MDAVLSSGLYGRQKRADTDPGCAQVADLVDLKYRIYAVGVGQDIIYTIRGHGVQTAAEGEELDQLQILAGFYIIGRPVQTGMIHPLVGNDERTVYLG